MSGPTAHDLWRRYVNPDFVPISFGNVHELGCEEVLRRLAERFPLPAKGGHR